MLNKNIANPNIDYVTTTFEYLISMKIHDMPTYLSLHTKKNEIKTNAARVPCDLGEGSHGHLGLVLTPV